MSVKITLAPIQGVTEYHFRNTFQKYFRGIDEMYSPYLRLDHNQELRKSKVRDVLPENNTKFNLTPQIMTNTPEGFLFLAKFLEEKGYTKINWNLGCPFPMVTNRKLGSGLLPHYKEIDKVLEKVFPQITAQISIKMRLGLDNDQEIFQVLPILNKYSISEIIIHPRTGKQMYKGDINLEIFKECLNRTDHKISYNGDINNLNNYKQLKNKFDIVDSWMIGRGIVANPFLAMQIKGESISDDKIRIFKLFHDELVDEYLNTLSGSSHLLNRMRVFWEYFSLSFSNSHKVYKRIKKATSIDKYYTAAEQNFTSENWIA